MNVFLAAVIDAIQIDGALPADRIHVLGAVPEKPTMPYVVVSVSPAEPVAYTLDATHGARTWRITKQSFARSIDGALDFDQSADEALLDKRLVVLDYDCGPCRQELSGAVIRDPDGNGVVGITSTLTFTAIKE